MKTSHKGFIAPLLLALIAVLMIGGVAYVYVQIKQIDSNAHNPPEITASTTQTSVWKTYTNTQYGFLFQYPSYLGDVVVETTNGIPYCPVGKTYNRRGVIVGARTIVTFSKKPPVGTGGSYMMFSIPVVQKAKTNAEICGTDLLILADNLAKDWRYPSSVFQQKNSIETYKSPVGTVIDTSADIFYTMFSRVGTNITVIQPRTVFIPIAYDNEVIDTSLKTGDNATTVTFINESQTQSAKQIRGYLADFEQFVQSIKFIPVSQATSTPVDNYSSQYPDPSTMP